MISWKFSFDADWIALRWLKCVFVCAAMLIETLLFQMDVFSVNDFVLYRGAVTRSNDYFAQESYRDLHKIANARRKVIL